MRIHLGPSKGWTNDPIGPLFYKGVFHLFYQHVPNKTSWDWGIVWGHVATKDFVNWKRLAVALEPTPGSLDTDGCFSGTAIISETGVPHLFYTGVVRNINRGLEKRSTAPDFNEVQLYAVPKDLDDPWLTEWVPSPDPWLTSDSLPFKQTYGWRDPFIWKETLTGTYMALIGSGCPELSGGTALLYESTDITKDWKYKGPLTSTIDNSKHLVWECPNLIKLHGETYLFCFSPDNCQKAPLAFVGSFDGSNFIKEHGPFFVDHGNILYAPTFYRHIDKCSGVDRVLCFGWMQESNGTTGETAGCIGIPRIVSFDKGKLRFDPLPELESLHSSKSTAPTSESFEVQIPSQVTRFELLITETVVFGFSRNEKIVSFYDEKELSKIPVEQDTKFTIYIDKSLIEVFASNGMVFSTRIYFKGLPNITVEPQGCTITVYDLDTIYPLEN